MEKKSKVLKKLFFSTLYLSTFTFGGGYVIVTLDVYKRQIIDISKHISADAAVGDQFRHGRLRLIIQHSFVY